MTTRLHMRAAYCGAPAILVDLIEELDDKVGIDKDLVVTALMQPFISGKIDREDAQQIAESSRYLLLVPAGATVEEYTVVIERLHRTLKAMG